MELNGYRLLLPEGTLDYFDLVDVKESVNEVVIYRAFSKVTDELHIYRAKSPFNFSLLVG